MAEIISNNSNTSRNKSIRKSLKIDMTPMVDLGFLLITFFIFTTTLAEPVGINLIVPKEGKTRDNPASKSLTLLLGKNNKVFAYKGTWHKAVETSTIQQTNYHLQGAGKIIRDHQALLDKRDELVVIIKPTKESSYKNLIDILDEMQINAVSRYAIVQPDKEEAAYVLSK
jgi:biopolymer transport protein ExbD